MRYYYGSKTDVEYALWECGGVYRPVFAEKYGAEPVACSEALAPITDEKTVAALDKYMFPYGAEGKKVYMAGPLFNEGDRYCNARISDLLRAHGYTTFLPQEIVIDNESTELMKAACFYMDLKAIRESDYMVINCNGIDMDSGTAAEVGLGYGWGKKMVGYKSDVRNYFNETHRLNNFVAGLLQGELCTTPEQVLAALRRL